MLLHARFSDQFLTFGAQRAIPHDQELDIRAILDHPGGGADQVQRVLLLVQPPDHTDQLGVRLQAQVHAQLALAGDAAELFQVNAVVDQRELVLLADALAEALANVRPGHGDDAVGEAGDHLFQGHIDPLRPGGHALVHGPSVDVVQNDRDAGQQRGEASDDARHRGMRMDDIELAFDHDLAQLEDRLEIGEGRDAVDQARHDARGEAHIEGAVADVVAARGNRTRGQLDLEIGVVAQVAGNVEDDIGGSARRQAGDDQQDAQAARHRLDLYGSFFFFLIDWDLNGVTDKFHDGLLKRQREQSRE